MHDPEQELVPSGASTYGFGAVLPQKDETGDIRPAAFALMRLSYTETKFPR